MAHDRPLVAEQCRAARALVGWSRGELAGRCGVATSTLADFEAGKRAPYPRTLADVRRALEGAGVLFLAADAEAGPGARLALRVTAPTVADRGGREA